MPDPPDDAHGSDAHGSAPDVDPFDDGAGVPPRPARATYADA